MHKVASCHEKDKGGATGVFRMLEALLATAPMVRLVGHPKLDLVRLEQGKAIDHLQLVQTLKTALERQQSAAATRSAPMGGAVETQADRHVRYRAARYSR